MPSICKLSALLTLACLALAGRAADAAENYDNCTGFIDSLPTVITTQGVWCLRGNVSTAMTSGAAIEVATNNVTIDCNDFKIGGLGAGDTSAAVGIFANSRHNTTIRHCSIRGFRWGIQLHASSGNLVEDNRLDGNLYRGIHVNGSNNLVRRNVVRDTGGRPGFATSFAIEVEGDAIDNVVDGVHATATNAYPYGIVVNGYGSLARGNLVRGLEPSGSGDAYYVFVTGGGVTVSGNQVLATPFTTEDDGYGIYGTGADTFCMDNSVSPMTLDEYYSCDAAIGNL